MEMKLTRLWYTQLSTCGVLGINGIHFGYTLELPKKDGLAGSAIPAGRYQVTIADSPKWGRPIPLLMDVPNRTEIEIHPGDFPRNTEGCILVGSNHTQDEIGASLAEFGVLFPKIQKAVAAEGCWITIFDTDTGGVQSAVDEADAGL